MITVSLLEEEIAQFKKTCQHGLYEYSAPSESFRERTTSHFRQIKRQEKYGIYVVRQRDTREVLYIGKSGTIDSQGQFKGQDIPGRLKNVKGDVPANKWFRYLVQEKGPIVIEYIFLSKPKSPAFVEAVLLHS